MRDNIVDKKVFIFEDLGMWKFGDWRMWRLDLFNNLNIWIKEQLNIRTIEREALNSEREAFEAKHWTLNAKPLNLSNASVPW